MLRRTRWSTTDSRSLARGSSSARSRRFSSADAHALRADFGLADLRRGRAMASTRSSPSTRRQLARQVLSPSPGACRRPGGSRGRTRRCPRTANSTRPGRGPRAFFDPRRHRQVAAVDRGAAGRVGDLQPVAEQLRQQLQVRRLAAARAGAGEGEQRLQELHAAHVGEIHPGAIVHRQRLEEGDCRALGVQQRHLVLQVDRDLSGDGTGQASTHRPQPVQSSIGNRSVKRTSGKPRTLIGAERKLSGAPPAGARRSIFARMTPCGQTKLHWPHWMQMSGVPDRHDVGDVALLPRRRADGKVPSTGIRLTGMSSPRPSIIGAVTSRTNSGAAAGTTGCAFPAAARRLAGTVDLEQSRQRVVDGVEVRLHDCLALAP